MKHGTACDAGRRVVSQTVNHVTQDVLCLQVKYLVWLFVCYFVRLNIVEGLLALWQCAQHSVLIKENMNIYIQCQYIYIFMIFFINFIYLFMIK
jgi:hypothetical protein